MLTKYTKDVLKVALRFSSKLKKDISKLSNIKASYLSMLYIFCLL